MSTADINSPSTFDVDAWIDDVQRPELTVELNGNEAQYVAQVDALKAQIPAAEATPEGDRGINDPTPESLYAQIGELTRERSEKALKVRVQQITNAELAAAVAAGKEAGAAQDEWYMWGLAAALVEPAFTPAQLLRLKNRDRSGESQIDQLTAAVNGLISGLPVPS